MDIVARIKAYPGYKDLLVKIQSQTANDADFGAFVTLHRDLFGETLVFERLNASAEDAQDIVRGERKRTDTQPAQAIAAIAPRPQLPRTKTTRQRANNEAMA